MYNNFSSEDLVMSMFYFIELHKIPILGNLLYINYVSCLLYINY